MNTPMTPAWIEEATEAAAFAVAQGHIRCKGRALPACKEDCPCYFDAKAALRAFMEKVPLKGEPAWDEHKYADHFKNAETLRQLKEAFR